MSQSLELTIAAKDTASKVIQGVEQKVKNFGRDFGRQIAAMVGPMVLLNHAVGAIGAYMEKVAQKRKEAFDWGASLTASATKLNLTVEQFQAVEAAADATGESVDRVGKSFSLASNLIKSAKEGNLAAAESLEALGVNLTNIETTTPQDVLRALASALATTEDPAKRAQLAVAALGKSAAELQETLAKGFDISGALDTFAGLTTEEADFLRQQARRDREADNRERLAEARRQVAQRFLESDEGRGFLAAEQERIRSAVGPFGRGMSSMPASVLAQDPRIQAEVQAILAKRAAEAAAKKQVSPEVAGALARKAEEDSKKEKEEEEKAKRAASTKRETGAAKDRPLEQSRAREVTVSSLRSIGGAFAGEVAGGVDYNQVQTDLQRQMRDLLADIKRQGMGPTDITKPLPNGGYVPPMNLQPPSLTGSSGTRLA